MAMGAPNRPDLRMMSSWLRRAVSPSSFQIAWLTFSGMPRAASRSEKRTAESKKMR